MMYVVLCWSCRKAVMRLPGLEAPEGGNICGIYGVLRVFVVDTATLVWAAVGQVVPSGNFCYCSVTGSGQCSPVVVCVCVCECVCECVSVCVSV